MFFSVKSESDCAVDGSVRMIQPKMMMIFIEEKKWNGDGGARWYSAERKK